MANTELKHEVWDELIEQLTPEQRTLLHRIDLEMGGAHTDDMDQFVDALARHFPGLEPSIRSVAKHIFDTNNGKDPECGLGRKHPPIHTLHGCGGTLPAEGS